MERIVNQLEDYCKFGEDRVYILMAIARSKEHEEHSSNTEPVIREVVKEKSELEPKIDQLDHAVSRFDSKFRLYISANARNTMDALFHLRGDMDDWLKMRLEGNEGIKKKFKNIDSEFKSVLQKPSCKDETNFIFDLDEVSETDANQFEEILEEFTDVRMVRETPNGFHIVTEPFNYNELETDIEYELKTDGMIYLTYIGE